jgi:hypothetical protein
MLKKLSTIVAMLLMSQAFATYTISITSCPACTSLPGKKLVIQTWVYQYQGGPLVSKSYTAGICGSC